MNDESSRQPAANQARGVILIIEDHPVSLKLMTHLLDRYGHRVHGATNGTEGVALALTVRPDVILCDIQLPGLDGFGVRAAVSEKLPATPVVALTALAMVGDRERMLAAGFDGYLSKPIEPRTFIQAVEEHLPPRLRSGGGRTAT